MTKLPINQSASSVPQFPATAQLQFCRFPKIFKFQLQIKQKTTKRISQNLKSGKTEKDERSRTEFLPRSPNRRQHLQIYAPPLHRLPPPPPPPRRRPWTTGRKFNAGCMNSTKRQAPLSPSSFQEPVSKRATLHFPSSPSTTTAAAAEGLTGDDSHLFGFTRLPLPHPFPAASVTSPLRRTVSEPIHFASAINPPAPPQQSSEFSIPPNPVLRQPLQESPNRITVLQDSFPFPNAAPIIHRTVSDPNPVANLQVLATGGSPPPLPPPSPDRNVPSSPSCGESPSTKRLKRMKERLREMSQWWNQVVSEGDEEETESENYFNDNIQKEDSENEMENPSQKINQIQKDESENEMQNASQEAVWVEKNGECLVIHFKCPCGTGYQIILSGNDCYYKLTNF